MSVATEGTVGLSRSNAARTAFWTGSLVLLAVIVLASLAIGSKSISPSAVLQALTHPEVTTDDALVVRDLRVPRTVLGLLVGAALGTAGALIQALTRNPLADPGILGVNAGASMAVIIAVAVFGVTDVHGYLWFAFLGAVVVAVAVYLIGSAGRSGGSPVRFTLTGVGIGAVLAGIGTGITLLNPRAFDSLRSWTAGSVAGRPLDIAAAVAPAIGVGVLLALLVARDLNAIGLGDDMAAALGTRVALSRVLVVASVTLLVGAATAAAGPIGFVGLMVPHLARQITGPDQRWILALSLTLAPTLLLGSDVVGRLVLRPAELPVGIVTAFVGAPVLIWLARRSRVIAL